jgi:hypothetical protein
MSYLGPRRRALALSSALLVFACGGQKAAPKAADLTTAKGGVLRYLPLEDKTVFAYDTLSDAQKGMLVLEVRRPAASVAELVVAGRIQHLEIDATSVRHLGGGFLLKEPLTRGAKFAGDFGTVEITAAPRGLSVPAGSFNDCIETVETSASAASSKTTTTVYCAGVGIAFRKTEAESDEGSGSESLSLRSFGPKFEAFH